VFNSTVVAAAAATRAGVRRVVETATLTAALTNAFSAAPGIVASHGPDDDDDEEDEPAPFQPALESAVLKRHAATVAASVAAGQAGLTAGGPGRASTLGGGGFGRPLSAKQQPRTHRRSVGGAVGAGGGMPEDDEEDDEEEEEVVEEEDDDDVLCQPIEDQKVVFFKTNPLAQVAARRASEPAGYQLGMMPAETNQPEELASDLSHLLDAQVGLCNLKPVEPRVET